MMSMRTLLIGIAAIVAFAPAPARADECPALSVINCGHRGTGINGGAGPPENTLPSFEQAVLEGADMVELDVQHTSDGALVVIHDDTLDRTTDGTGCVGDLSFSELRQLDAGFDTPMAGTGVVVPTLTEVLAAVTVDVNVEIKINEDSDCPASDEPRLAADVAAAIAGDGQARRIIVSSFDAEVLSEVEAIDAGIYTGLLALGPADGDEAVTRGFDALNLFIATVRADVVEELHGKGLDVNVWTENDPGAMQIWFDFGVDMIITDDPNLFVEAQSDWCAAYVPPEDDGGGCSISGHGSPSSTWPLVALLGVFALRRRPEARYTRRERAGT